MLKGYKKSSSFLFIWCFYSIKLIFQKFNILNQKSWYNVFLMLTAIQFFFLRNTTLFILKNQKQVVCLFNTNEQYTI